MRAILARRRPWTVLLPLIAVLTPIKAASAAGQEPQGTVLVRVEAETGPVEGAEIRAGAVHAFTNERGEVRLTLPAGDLRLRVQRIGFATASVRVQVVAGEATVAEVRLHDEALELEGLTVGLTRMGRRVQDEPLRVEVLDREEIEEKMLMTPGNIVMLLNETGGLRVQVTSPSLGAANIRVQGMRGRYTQLLKAFVASATHHDHPALSTTTGDGCLATVGAKRVAICLCKQMGGFGEQGPHDDDTDTGKGPQDVDIAGSVTLMFVGELVQSDLEFLLAALALFEHNAEARQEQIDVELGGFGSAPCDGDRWFAKDSQNLVEIPSADAVAFEQGSDAGPRSTGPGRAERAHVAAASRDPPCRRRPRERAHPWRRSSRKRTVSPIPRRSDFCSSARRQPRPSAPPNRDPPCIPTWSGGSVSAPASSRHGGEVRAGRGRHVH